MGPLHLEAPNRIMPPLANASRLILTCAAVLLMAGSVLSDPVTAQPVLRFSTYLGGSAVDLSTAITLDANGYVYVAGQTRSDDFPTRAPAQAYQGSPLVGTDAFIAKLSPDGDSLIYATYLGGSMGEEMIGALAVDDQGRVLVAGTTTSADFPTQNPLHGFRPGDQLFSDAFVARLSADGASVDFATYLGGTGDESALALALGADGSVVVTGTTTSADFPTTPGVIQPNRSGEQAPSRMDAFVARLMPAGDAFDLDYATYLGGARDDMPNALAVDANGRVWIAGATTSADFPLENALQSEYAGPIRNLEGDAFVARLSADATALDFATYLGGGQDDRASGVALDAGGRVVVTGATMSGNFPTTPGAYQSQRQALRERFVVWLEPVGGSWTLTESTRLGAPSGFETGRAGVAIDRAGRAWIAGATASDQFPTRDAEQPLYGGGESDAFLARFDASGHTLGYATFLGGLDADVVTGVALGDDAVCVTGGTGSADFPVQAAVQSAFDGPSTAGPNLTSTFVTCFDAVNEAPVLTHLAVTPDTVALAPGATQLFVAEGADQFDQPFPVTPQWAATGGTIDASGLYTAGTNPGTFAVSATGGASSVSDTAVVEIGDDPIPVELTTFKGIVDEGTVLLTWETASETNNAGFEVQQRAKAGEDTWTKRAFVEGAGTTTRPQSYRYRVPDLSDGIHLFRLKQIDIDGAFEYSPVVEVALGAPQRFAFHGVYPNPSRGMTTIPFDVARATRVRLEAYDALGRRVAVIVDREYVPGRYRVEYDGRGWSSGMYFLVIEMGDFREVKQVVVLR